MAKFDIDLWLVHIQGVENKVADLLSRWKNTMDAYGKLQRLIND